MFTRNNRGERRASPSLYKVLLTSHVIVSVGWLGTVFAKIVLGIIGLTSGDPAFSRSMYVAMEALNIAYPILAISTAVTGVLLSLGTKWGLLQYYWVATKIVLTVGVIATAVAIAGRLGQEAIASALGRPASGATALEIISAPATLLLALSLAHLLMLGIATVLSVYKPWGKTWFARRKDAGPRMDYTIARRPGDATARE